MTHSLSLTAEATLTLKCNSSSAGSYADFPQLEAIKVGALH